MNSLEAILQEAILCSRFFSGVGILSKGCCGVLRIKVVVERELCSWVGVVVGWRVQGIVELWICRIVEKVVRKVWVTILVFARVRIRSQPGHSGLRP